MRGVEQRYIDDALERALGAHPHLRRVDHPLALELERDPVVDVVADVLLVAQHLVHHAPGPRPSEIGREPVGVEDLGDLGLVPAVLDEQPVDPVHGLDFLGRPRHQDHTVGLQALLLAALENALGGPVLVDAHAPQPVARRPALAVAPLDQPALAGEHLGRQLAAVLARHRPLDPLDDGRDRRAVIGELLGAVMHRDAGALADVFVIGAFVGVLEPTPAADVVDQDDLEIGAAPLDVGDEPRQRIAALEPQPALALIGIGADDRDAVIGGVAADGVALVLGRILLMLGRHAHVLRGAHLGRAVGAVDCDLIGRRMGLPLRGFRHTRPSTDTVFLAREHLWSFTVKNTGSSSEIMT